MAVAAVRPSPPVTASTAVGAAGVTTGVTTGGGTLTTSNLSGRDYREPGPNRNSDSALLLPNHHLISR